MLGKSLKKTVKMAFMSGFSEHISMELQQLTRIENMEVEEVLRHARMLVKKTCELDAVATALESSSKLDEEEQTVRRSIRKFIVKCFWCQGLHLVRDCKELRLDITCFRADWTY